MYYMNLAIFVGGENLGLDAAGGDVPSQTLDGLRWRGRAVPALSELCVLGLLVSTEVDLPLKSPTAQVAGEGLVARVLPRVGDEVGALGESLPAHLAFVRFLTQINKFSASCPLMLSRC